MNTYPNMLRAVTAVGLAWGMGYVALPANGPSKMTDRCLTV